MSSALKLAGSQKNTFSSIPDTVQLLNGQKAFSFSFFLVVIPAFVHPSDTLFSAAFSSSLHTTLPKPLLPTVHVR